MVHHGSSRSWCRLPADRTRQTVCKRSPHTHTHTVWGGECGSETEGLANDGKCTAFHLPEMDGWKLQLWIVKGDWQESITPSECRFLASMWCRGGVVVNRESKDWHACLHSSSSVIRSWCTLTLLMTARICSRQTLPGKCHSVLVSDRPLVQS